MVLVWAARILEREFQRAETAHTAVQRRSQPEATRGLGSEQARLEKSRD
jgi:hypothetical protein